MTLWDLEINANIQILLVVLLLLLLRVPVVAQSATVPSVSAIPATFLVSRCIVIVDIFCYCMAGYILGDPWLKKAMPRPAQRPTASTAKLF
jgi:hypothetical protein